MKAIGTFLATVVVCVAVLLIALMVYGAYAAQTPATARATAASATPAARVPVQFCLDFVGSAKGEVSEYTTTITGEVRNSCHRNFRYVAVSYKLIDASGATVGTALANLGGFADGETWKFKAVGFTPAGRFLLNEITAF